TIIGLNEKPVSLKNGIVVHDASIDDDNEFESYDHSHGTVKIDVEKPNYIRLCLANLLATNNIDRFICYHH
ncbi:unnamed protein product, partial [Rotaria sp. Silwood1]